MKPAHGVSLLVLASLCAAPQHGTTGQAKLWKQYLDELLQSAPRR